MARRNYKNFGGRIGSEDDENRLLDRVYDLTCQGYTRDQIANLIGREKTAVTRYWKKLISQGRLEKTKSGRVKKSQIQKEKQHYEELLKSEWLDGKNPEVKIWIDKMLKGGKKGTGVVAWKSKVSAFYTEKDNGLNQDWNKDFFMNPPYSQIGAWMKKAYDQHIKHNVTGLILVYAKCGVKWFEDYVYDYSNDMWLAEFKPINHRIQFKINGIIPRYCKICKKKFYEELKICPNYDEITGKHTVKTISKIYPDDNGKLTKNFAPYDSCWIIFRKRNK